MVSSRSSGRSGSQARGGSNFQTPLAIVLAAAAIYAWMTAPPSFSTPPMPDRMLPPMDMARADVGHDACEDLGRLQQCETNIEQAKKDSQTAARKEAALTVNANAATEVEELMNQRHSAEGSTLTQALYKAAVGHAAEEHRLAAQAAQWHREAKAHQEQLEAALATARANKESQEAMAAADAVQWAQTPEEAKRARIVFEQEVAEAVDAEIERVQEAREAEVAATASTTRGAVSTNAPKEKYLIAIAVFVICSLPLGVYSQIDYSQFANRKE